MRRRNLGFTLSLVLVGALMAGQAAPAVAVNHARFGSKLTNADGSVRQPANAPRACDVTGPHEGDPCTVVSLIAAGFDTPGHEKAPKDGVINKVRLVALNAGSFRLFFAKAQPGSNQAKVVKKGPTINFSGDSSSPYTIEVKNVNISVKKGWYIAVQASQFQTVSCTSGSTALLEFQPPLVVGHPFETADGHNGCNLLVQLQYQ